MPSPRKRGRGQRAGLRPGSQLELEESVKQSEKEEAAMHLYLIPEMELIIEEAL